MSSYIKPRLFTKPQWYLLSGMILINLLIVISFALFIHYSEDDARFWKNLITQGIINDPLSEQPGLVSRGKQESISTNITATATISPPVHEQIVPEITQTKESSQLIFGTNTNLVAETPAVVKVNATPNEVKQILIGYSVAGRPIYVYQYGSGDIERMIVAGIHGGNEYNTVLLAETIQDALNKYPELLPGEITLFILPDLNPDGYYRSHDIHGRANENNVDLNHNFPVGWNEKWNRKGCWNYLTLNGGDEPASEPETKALMNFIVTHQVDALISYHSAALGIFPGGDPPDPASIKLVEAIDAVSDYPYPPIDAGCSMTGAMADWLVSQGIAVVEVELTNHTDIDFDQNMLILQVLLNWRR